MRGGMARGQRLGAALGSFGRGWGWARVALLVGFVSSICGANGAAADPVAGPGAGSAPASQALGADPAKRAVAPIAPALAGGIVADLQSGKYVEAIRALDALIADEKTSLGDRSFYRLVRGGAARLAGRPDDARSTWQAALDADPKGPWVGKLRGEMASLELATGHPDRAEALARAEAETLLAPERKDRLATVYRDYAERLLHPNFPGARPDPLGAYALLAKARDLAKGNTLRAALLFAQARAGQEAVAPPPPQTPEEAEKRRMVAPPQANAPRPDPIGDYNAYIKEYPNEFDRDAARFHLGETQLALGQTVAARLTWTDLARDAVGDRAKKPSQAGIRLRQQALYGIARTYGVPRVRSATDLALGVAALERFLREAPEAPEAPRASFEIGQAYLARGQADPAIAAFRAFLKGDNYRAPTTDDLKRDLATRRMQATFLIARATLGQGKYPEAVAAFEAYLAQFANGPQSADARRAILDARFAEAQDALARERFADARTLFAKFADDYPLDNRVPAALFEVGSTFAREKRWDDAIAAWDALASRFPAREEATHAQFEAASLVEAEKGDPAAAIERFRKIRGNSPWVAQAAQRIATMEGRALTVVTPRAFRSGETAHLKIATRNLPTLTFSAYKLNPEAYFRKKQGLNGVASLDIGLVAPDAEWTAPVPGYAQYKPVETTYDLKVSVPGVYVVKVSDEKHLQASALVVGSDVEAIVKASRDQLLVFAQDMRTGQGRPGARVLVADGERVVFEGVTGPDGVVQGTWKKDGEATPPAERAGALPEVPAVPAAPAPAPDAALQYLVLDGASAAGSGLGVPDQVARGLTPRAYIDTDRPAYRPGQEVAIRGVIREASEGQYRNPAGATYKLEVADSQGRTLVARPVTLGPFGTFHEKVALAEGAPVGTYSIRVAQPGGSTFNGGFEVQSYQLARLSLDFDLPRTVYYRGEVVKATLRARYGFDAPASGRPIAVQLPDGRTLRGQTDAAGQFAVEFPTEGFGEDQALSLRAVLSSDNVAARAGVRLASLGFGIDLKTARSVYLDGETITLDATTRDALGEPTGQNLRVAVVKPVTQGRRTVEREVSSLTFTTDKATGKGRVALRVEEPAKADYILRVAGTDQFGHAVVADTRVVVSGQKDDEKLRIIADRTSFRVGEEARVRLVNRGTTGPALIAWEADRILRYKVVPVPAGESNLDWPVDDAQFPNFTLAAARMAEQRLDQARLDVRVERDLRLTVTPKAPTFAPGAEVEVEIRAEDQMGRPVAAEVGLALVDRALLRRFGDRLPPIGPFFYDQTRVGGFRTESTVTFSDHPATEAVPDAVVDEAERQAALARNQANLQVVTEGTRQMTTWAAPHPNAALMPFGMAAAPAPASPPDAEAGQVQLGAQGIPLGGFEPGSGMGGMGGGMGGMMGRAAGRVERDMELEDFPNQSFADIAEDKSEAAKSKDSKNIRDMRTDLDEAPSADKPGAAPAKAAGRRMFQRGVVANAEPRQAVVETAYWNPSVVTGADGRATVKFQAPPALSEYRLMARGVTGNDSLVGQAAATVTVRQDFFVDLKAPSRLTEGDKPRFVAEIHHSGIKAGTVAQVRLVAYAEGGQEQVDPKTVEIKGDGVTEVSFDPINVPDTGSIRLTVTARAGDRGDETTVEIPVHPWGVEAVASASGTSSNNATVQVGLPSGRSYDDLALRIELAPSLDRLVVGLALESPIRIFGLGAVVDPLGEVHARMIFPPCPTYPSVAQDASDLLAAVAALRFLGDARATDPSEATRLRDRARGLAAQLVSSQNDDGGWPWVASGTRDRVVGSHRLTSTRAAWALKEAADSGVEVDPKTLDKAADYLAVEWPKTGNDPTARAATLHALAVLGRATFEQANTLNRTRTSLGDFALSYLALAFRALDRPTLAGEVLDVLLTRAKTEATGPGSPPRTFWEGKGGDPALQGPAEATALATLALARLRPAAPQVESGVAWLLAHRTWLGWNPGTAKGAAAAAIALARGKAAQADDRYRLVVSVNETEVARIDVAGPTPGQTLVVPRKALRNGGAANAVRFAIEGRGTFGYSATLTGFARDFGPDQKRDGRPVVIDKRDYLAAAPELEGRTLPTGFGSVVNPTPFVNKVTEVARGGRARVEVTIGQEFRPGLADWQREFVIVEETLPAGATLVEGSVQTTASSYTVGDGTITFAFPPENAWRTIQYELAGFVPGEYRVLPTRLRNAYDPNQVHLGPAGALKVLPPGTPGTDPYRASPDELLARGKQLAEADRFAEAAVPLEELFAGYAPKDEVARDAARILLTAHIRDFDARRVVRDFEVLKEKGPEVVIPFDEVLVVGRAYRDIREPERAFLVFRALAEASYLEDAQVGEVLRQNGQPLEAITYLLDLWRESPGSASIEADLFGLSQVATEAAGRALNDVPLREAMARAEVSRVALLGQSIRLIQTLLALNPKTPLADEASLALLGNELELEDFEAVTRLAPRFASLYPKSKFLDSFQYADALGRFQLGQYDQAIETARRIASATYPDPNGVPQPSPNKWQALYILGQIHDARRQPGEAIGFYKQVADRFSDAADAVAALGRRTLSLPEVTILRPKAKEIGGDVTLRPAPGKPEEKLILSYRNVAEVDLKVYPVDLMRLYLTRRNLDGIAGIDLAGITPLHESTLKLADGLDYADATKDLDLPIVKEGAYLVMVRGGDLYASGIVLVSPLELEVTEEAQAGRVRVVVRDAANQTFVPKAQVKVIGSNNPSFTDGRTDLRGVVVAERISGQVTAVARREGGQYAFYRGTQSIGQPPAQANAPAEPNAAAAPAGAKPDQAGQSLDENIRSLNSSNAVRNIDRLQNRFRNAPQGVQVQEAR